MSHFVGFCISWRMQNNCNQALAPSRQLCLIPSRFPLIILSSHDADGWIWHVLPLIHWQTKKKTNLNIHAINIEFTNVPNLILYRDRNTCEMGDCKWWVALGRFSVSTPTAPPFILNPCTSCCRSKTRCGILWCTKHDWFIELCPNVQMTFATSLESHHHLWYLDAILSLKVIFHL